jgi:dTDP-4-amino-4,6-dideoxygalactose transaminase
MANGIQLFKASFDIEACLLQVRECLEAGWTGMGFKTVQFEDAWKKYTGAPYAYYLNSATAALNLAVEILKEENGWDDDDEVVTTPCTFVSTNHAIVLAKMIPVFADIDDTLCLDPKSVEERITDKTRAVMYVAFGGNTGRYPEIVDICRKHNLKLILDAAHLAGTRLDGKIPGSEADCVAWSFQAVKNLPTGDSGMICFKKEEYDAIARKKAWLGINKDTYARTLNSETGYRWQYDVEYIGNKYNGNAIMAGIALAQLPLLDRDNAYRRQLAAWYTEAFKNEPKIKLAVVPKECESSCHLFQIIVENRDELMLWLNANDIFPGVHYVANTKYKMYCYADGTCPKADYISDHIISLPMHMGLSYDDVQTITGAVLKYVNKH